jgi:iron(III) transport system ATP-binding protein
MKEVTKYYGETLGVGPVSFQVNPGEFLSLLGPSGCGKTTTLRIIAGFEEPTSGDVFQNGKRINDLPPEKRDAGFVFQSYALFPHLSVFGNVAFGLKIRKMDRATIERKVRDILELVGLPGMFERYPAQLSGGQQQRVALARALVTEPAVLLLDEPLSNLDLKLRVEMRSELKRLQKRIGFTAIYVTHDQGEALTMSDRIVVLHDGGIEQVGSPYDIYERPTNEFVSENPTSLLAGSKATHQT